MAGNGQQGPFALPVNPQQNPTPSPSLPSVPPARPAVPPAAQPLPPRQPAPTAPPRPPQAPQTAPLAPPAQSPETPAETPFAWAAEAVPLTPPPAATPPAPSQAAPEDEEDEYGEAVYWTVVGWSPDQPFQGEIVFTDEYDNFLTAIPVEPEAMKNLNDITGEILEWQYAAFGVSTDDEEGNSDGKKKKKGKDQEPNPNLKRVEKNIGGVPFALNVNMRYLTIFAVVAAVMLGFTLVSTIMNR